MSAAFLKHFNSPSIDFLVSSKALLSSPMKQTDATEPIFAPYMDSVYGDFIVGVRDPGRRPLRPRVSRAAAVSIIRNLHTSLIRFHGADLTSCGLAATLGVRFAFRMTLG